MVVEFCYAGNKFEQILYILIPTESDQIVI